MLSRASFELWYQDEAEFHLHPHLAGQWAPRGHQPVVRSPGQNKKWTVYGALNFLTGEIDFEIRKTKNGAGFLAQIMRLVERAKRTRRKIFLVCDGPRFHKTKKVLAYLPDVARYIEVFWLPAYCPDLNLIERLWGHVKRTYVANVLFRSENKLHDAVQEVFAALNRKPGSALEVVFNVNAAA